ncbi:hypothetical protein ACQ4PT_060186 [Festuca glaucescens]
MESDELRGAPRPPETAEDVGDAPRPPETAEDVGDAPRPPEIVEVAHDAPRPPETVEAAPASRFQWPEIDIVLGPSGTVLRYAPAPGWRPTQTEIEEEPLRHAPALGSQGRTPVIPEEERPSSRSPAKAPPSRSQWRPTVSAGSSSSSGANGGGGAASSSSSGASGGGGAASSLSSGAADPTGASGGGGASAQRFDSERLPPTLVQQVQPLLRVANLLDGETPRVAYLCRFHAFEKADLMDPKSEERGVRQFKTALFQTLHQDDKITSLKRIESDDAREIKSFYEKSADCFKLGWPMRLDNDFFFSSRKIDTAVSKQTEQDLRKSERDDPTKFALGWNEIIKSFRSEDLINNRELDLLTMPMSLEYSSSTCWPLFLLAEKLSKAVDMATNFTGSSAQFFCKIKKDDNMFCAINDFYDLIKSIFGFLVVGDVEKRVVDSIYGEIEKSVQNSHLLVDFKLTGLDILVEKIHQLSELLVKRLYLLLNTKEKAVDIPSNLEARRRISFFATSLLMNMPAAPQVRSMLSFSIITPYFMEEVKYSEEELHSNQNEGSILSYMQKIYPDEWRNFLERLGSKVTNEDIRCWASFRGQTLSRTVRGMMYYRKALRLQAYLDRTNDQELCKGPVEIEQGENKCNVDESLTSELDTLAEMKFSYVIACQKFGEYKSNNDPRAQDIIDLMARYPALRVAYIEEKAIIIGNRPRTEIYRIKLPGAPIIGEGKPENQNLAIIFTRGEALQTIDMNQDNYLEEAYKMRNILQEFVRNPRDQCPTILGLREHIFTGSVSSLAGFMSYQETGFVTIGQRFLADPLR